MPRKLEQIKRFVPLCTIILSAVYVLCLVPDTHAGRRKGEMVTWGTFQFVRSVGASISHAYFATTDGIVRYNKLEQRWEDPLTGAEGLDQSLVRRIWPTRFDDHLYAQIDLGYADYDVFFDRWYLRSDLPPLDTVYHQITVPLDLIPPVNFNFFPNGSMTDMAGRTISLTGVAQDNTGDLWIGTWGFGPACTRGGSRIIEFLTCGLLNRRVDAILPLDSQLCLAGALTVDSRAGITTFDPVSGSSTYIEGGVVAGFPTVDISALAVDSIRLFAGTPFGLLVIDRDGGRVLRTIDRRAGLADDSVICLKFISDSLFVGTAAGLSLFRNDTIRIIAPRTFGKCRIFDLEPQGNNLWIASDYGAFRLDRATGEIARFSDPGQFTSGRVYDIAAAGGFLWMSADNGLLKINLKTAQTEPLRLSVLPNIRRPLAVNSQVAAVASDRGFVLFHHDRARSISREFTTDDGLPSERIRALYLDGDFLWIGSDGGLTRFLWNNPDRVD